MRVPSGLRRFAGGVTAEDVQRFDAALHVAETELSRRRGDGSAPWLDAASDEIDNARRFRSAFKLEAGWAALKSGTRQLVAGYSPGEMVAEARTVRQEADEKLTGWRRASVAELLPDELLDQVSLENGGLTVERRVRTNDRSARSARFASSPVDADDRGGDPDGADASQPVTAAHDASALRSDLLVRLVKSKWVVDTHADNVYHKFRLLRRAVIITTVSLGLILVVLAVIVAAGWVPDALTAENSPLDSWRLLALVMCLGAIGAYLSSATQLTARDAKVRISDLRVDYTLMGMRPVVGAAGAIVVIVMIQSAFGQAVDLDATAVLGVAIAAGFTERLVTRTVASAADAVGT